MVNKFKFVEEIIKTMEERNFTQGEANSIPSLLDRELKKNSERAKYREPFTIHPIV